MTNTYKCQTCSTELKRHEAVLRGNAIDNEPAAWCRRDAVAAGLLVLPLPPVTVAVPAPEARRPLLVRLFAGQPAAAMAS